MRPSRTAFISTMALALSCGPSYSLRGFDVNYPDSRGEVLGSLSRTLASSDASEGASEAVVVLVPPPPARGFRVFELPSGRALWASEALIDSRPFVTPTLVIAHAGAQTVAWDRATGAERFHIADPGAPLLAAQGDARHVALTFSAGGLGQQRTAVRVVEASNGATVFSREVEHSIGTPAVLRNHLLLPWSGQYLSVFDLRNDTEVARIRSTDDVFTRAWSEEGAGFFGARAIYRLDESMGGGSRPGGTASYVLDPARLPGTPPLLLDGYARTHAGLDARERVRIAARPDPALPGVQPAGGSAYALYHRIVFALDRPESATAPVAPQWAYTHERDVASVEPVRGGVLLVDEAGQVVYVTSGGQVQRRLNLEAPAAQAVFFAPLSFTMPPEGGAPEPPPVARGLLAAVGGTDTRMLPARIFAVRALVQTPGPEATRALLDVSGRSSYPPEIVAAAREALAARTLTPDVLLEALASRQDWVRGTPAPAVGPLARALAAANDRRAVPLLAAHLQDPATPAADLAPLTAALETLGDASAVPALLDFLRLYHADEGVLRDAEGRPVHDDRTIADIESTVTALATAARTVARLGGATERRWLAALASDANTMRALREPLARATAPQSDQPAPGSSTAPADAGAAPEGPPMRATRELIEQGFAPVRGQMLACLEGLASRPASVRLTFHYNGDGSLNTVAVAPTSLGACILPIARGVRLPPTQVRTDTGSYYLVGGHRP